ncbi:hypothetical protein [Sphingomicrobium clamense]|uniref:Uncharacterized protein n=1 Tax=Sphingomicrobium clamense TaxID=2851013 RepID=A0ABS6V7H2_9SPHN|nr:hypothetical protein [Sphingomicrobium sp. B8]MBW0145473.1 hypothetical protein [Sphingomicrobium sp. B8]
MTARATRTLIVGLALAAGTSSVGQTQDNPRGLDLANRDVGMVSTTARPPAVRRVIIRNQLILKIPLQPRQATPMQYQVLEAPRCLATRAIAGARLSGERSIDFLISRDRRLRAHMDSDCKSLDFYGGFYLQPTDERLCAGRDVIRTRMGGNCRIERFQLLQPVES